MKHLVGKLLLLVPAMLSGCFLLPHSDIGKPVPDILSHQRILTANHLHQGANGGKLWDRAEFFLNFPIHLLAIGNSIEQQNIDFDTTTHTTSSVVAYKKNEKIIRKMLQSPTPKDKTWGLEMIFPPNSNFQYSRIMSALADEDPYVRIVAVYLLFSSKDFKMNSELLFELLNDKDPFVRLETIRFLHKKKYDQDLTLFYKALQDRSPLVRGESAKALGNFGFQQSSLYIQKLLKDPEPYVREQAKQALQRLTPSLRKD